MNTLYTAPDCIRCKIVKSFFAEKNIEYKTLDFKGDAQEFNAFYRANRNRIYRNPEGVEFPLFDDGTVIKQGSGEVIAYILAGESFAECGAITRSDLLHGWISGLYISSCPDEQEDNFIEVVKQLAAGGLQICLQSDGRKADFLEKLLALQGIKKVQLNILGSNDVYNTMFGQSITQEDLAKSIALVQTSNCGEIRFLASPINRDGGWAWPSRTEVSGSAKMVFEACNDHQLSFNVTQVTAGMPQGLQGLEPVSDAIMLKYRSAIREFLFKADIVNN